MRSSLWPSDRRLGQLDQTYPVWLTMSTLGFVLRSGSLVTFYFAQIVENQSESPLTSIDAISLIFAASLGLEISYSDLGAKSNAQVRGALIPAPSTPGRPMTSFVPRLDLIMSWLSPRRFSSRWVLWAHVDEGLGRAALFLLYCSSGDRPNGSRLDCPFRKDSLAYVTDGS